MLLDERVDELSKPMTYWGCLLRYLPPLAERRLARGRKLAGHDGSTRRG